MVRRWRLAWPGRAPASIAALALGLAVVAAAPAGSDAGSNSVETGVGLPRPASLRLRAGLVEPPAMREENSDQSLPGTPRAAKSTAAVTPAATPSPPPARPSPEPSEAPTSPQIPADPLPPPGYAFIDQRWPGEIAYCVNPAGSPPEIGARFQELVRHAFSLWQGASLDALPLVDTGVCANNPEDHGDGVNTIGWGATAYTGGPAEALRTYEPSQPTILESDIVFNGQLAAEYRSDACILDLLLHEVGHFLGIDHPQGPTASVMAAAEYCQWSQLSDTDAQAIRYLYHLPSP